LIELGRLSALMVRSRRTVRGGEFAQRQQACLVGHAVDLFIAAITGIPFGNSASTSIGGGKLARLVHHHDCVDVGETPHRAIHPVVQPRSVPGLKPACR
jgi:hypothetical protein